jgi:LacI family transcriptional regulator
VTQEAVGRPGQIIYVAGGEIEGVVQALRERTDGRHVTVVAMDLLRETREAPTEGVVDLVIATPIVLVATSVVSAMLDRLDGNGREPNRSALPFDLYVSENL